MIRLRRGIDFERARWLLVIGAACLLDGVLAGIDPLYGVLLAIGAGFVGLVLVDLAVGFSAFTALSFLDMLSSSGSFSGTKVIGVILVVSWLAQATASSESGDSVLREHPAFVVSLLCMLGWSALSFAWAASPGTALSATMRFALDMLLIPVGFAALRRQRDVVWVLVAFVLGAVISVLYGFVHPVAATSASAGRLSGTLGDPNEEAAVLVAAIPLVFAAVTAWGGTARVRIAGGLALFVLLLGVVDTGSRGGLVALAGMMATAVLIGGRWRRRAAVMLALGAVVTVGYFFVFAPLTVRDRVTSSDTSGRTSIWAVASRVIAAHPILGVGTDNFILVEAHYINQPGLINAHYIVVLPKVAHDTYIEALTDLGVPGLLTLLAVLGTGIGSAVRAAWRFEAARDRSMELIARAVVIALAGMLTADFFVSNQYAKSLWLLLALCPVLLSMGRVAEADAGVIMRRTSEPAF